MQCGSSSHESSNQLTQLFLMPFFPSPLPSAPSQSGVPPPSRLLPPPKLHRSEAVLVYNSSNMMYRTILCLRIVLCSILLE